MAAVVAAAVVAEGGSGGSVGSVGCGKDLFIHISRVLAGGEWDSHKQRGANEQAMTTRAMLL